MDLLLQDEAVVGLLALVFFYLIWLMIRSNNPNKSKTMIAPEPPGAWPIIGHLLQLSRREPLFRILGAMADKCGPIFALRFGKKPVIVISNWEIAKECFTTNDRILASRPPNAAGKHMAYNYAMIGFAPHGPYWREIRKISTLELLSNNRLELLKHVRYTEIETSIKELYRFCVKKYHGNSVKVEMKQWFGALTMNIVIKMVVGKRYFNVKNTNTECQDDDEETRQFQKTIIDFFEFAGLSVASDALPFLAWMDLKGEESAMKRIAKEIDEIAEKWLQEHRIKRLSERDEADKDFMDVLLSILEEDFDGDAHLFGYNRDTIVKATSLALILAASDTTSISLTWALSLLLNNRSTLKKVQDELDIHVGKDRVVDESDIENLVYLQAVIKETLRLYPAGPLAIPHQAIKDCQIGGFHVTAGTQLLVNLWKLHRDTSVWKDPWVFQPERFLTDHSNVDIRGHHFELIPFGSGRRSCPGISFALQIMHLTLAKLLHGFDFATPLDAPVDMNEGSGLTCPKATPLELHVTPRLPSKLYE